MNDKITACLQNIASDFACLANELEKQQKDIDSKMNYIENGMLQNRQALKDAASAILGRLG